MKQRLWMALILATGLSSGAAFAQSAIVINEVYPDSPSTDVDTWLELKGTPGMSLDGYLVIGVKGSDGTDYQPIPLDTYTVPADGYFLITQDCARPHSNLCSANVNYFNTNANVQLRYQGNVVDALGYGTPTFFRGEGSPSPNPSSTLSLARCPDGFDSNDNRADFKQNSVLTPGSSNDPGCPPLGVGACCLPSGTCVLTTRSECAAQQGSYLGDGTTCNPYPCPPVQASLCQIAEDGADGVPVLNGRLVECEGVAIVASGIWSTTTQDFSFTDGDCCTSVFGGALNPMVQIGDRVHVIGTVAHFNGRTEITNPGLLVTVISGGHPIPDPMPITTYELFLNGEQYESCLISLHCVRIVGGDPWPPDGINANLTVDDGSGPTTLRIDKDTDIDGTPAPTGPFSAVGIGWQFDTTSPFTEGFQILPRSLTDLIYDCAPPTGACCLPGGSCLVVAQAECDSLGGTFQGPGTGCDPNPCAQPTGACCVEGERTRTIHCVITTRVDCEANGGIYMGDGVPCDPDPCPQPEGACCAPDGTCTITTETDCTGQWLGEDTVCDPNPCTQPVGACCAPDGSCTITTEADCTGEWLGQGTVCDPNPCPQPTGACCFVTGECRVLTAEECVAQQGTYQGDGTGCNPNPCPPPVPTKNTTWGQIKHQYR